MLGGKYLLQHELGRGGMGAVYVALNTWTGRAVAIKTLKSEVARSQQLLDRFWQEGRAASRLQHPNIIDVLDMGWDDATGEPFLVQEYLEGVSFDQYVKQGPGGCLNPSEALALLLPVAGALMACHRAGILHRDVKPSNIVITTAQDGTICPKLIDFGISKDLDPAPDAVSHTATGVPMGSPAYMPPEQARGDRDLDARADVWSFGATLFEALTGKRPFLGATAAIVLAKVIYEPPPRIASVLAEIPRDLAAVVDAMLTHDRDHRLPSMDVVVTELLACAAARTEMARAVTGFSRTVADAFNESASGERVRAFVVGPPVPAASAGPVSSTHEPWSKVAPAAPRRSAAVPVAVAVSFLAFALAMAGMWYTRRASVVAPPPALDASSRVSPDVPNVQPEVDAAHMGGDAATIDTHAATREAEGDAAAVRRQGRPVGGPVSPPTRPRPIRRDPLAPDDDPYEATR